VKLGKRSCPPEYGEILTPAERDKITDTVLVSSLSEESTRKANSSGDKISDRELLNPNIIEVTSVSTLESGTLTEESRKNNSGDKHQHQSHDQTSGGKETTAGDANTERNRGARKQPRQKCRKRSWRERRREAFFGQILGKLTTQFFQTLQELPRLALFCTNHSPWE